MTLDESSSPKALRLRRILRGVRNLIALAATILLTIYFVRAIDASHGIQLEPWHSARLDEEFRVGHCASFDEYLALEDRLFEELDALVADWNSSELGRLRFQAGSRSDPSTFAFDGNRSFELPRSDARGTAVLVHGLTDAPYSLRRIGEALHAAGLHVIAPRLPGHGTLPAGLLDVSWRDWQAVVRLAVEHARDASGNDGPIYVVGYSLGGALAVEYTLSALENEDVRTPDKLILLSPAIRVTSFASFAHLHAAVSWLPLFEPFQWESVGPEYDPFKYVSFPKNGATQMRAVTLAIEAGVERLAASERTAEFPPMLVFQSLVDTTVSSEAVLSGLMAPLAGDASALIVYDVNRDARLVPFLDAEDVQWLEDWTESSSRRFRLTVISNDEESPARVSATSRAARETQASSQQLDATWPADVYSFSHVALPFAPDDPVNGSRRNGDELNLGALAPRGERDLLRVSMKNLMRLRHNPFFDDLVGRIVTALN